MKILISLWLVFFAASASAQDFSVDERLIDQCVAANPDTPIVCVGPQSRVCMMIMAVALIWCSLPVSRPSKPIGTKH